MLANLIGHRVGLCGKKQSAFRIEHPTPPVTRDGKLMLWVNTPYNDWQCAASIMTRHSEHMDDQPVSLASWLSASEWEFLDKAANALASQKRDGTG